MALCANERFRDKIEITPQKGSILAKKFCKIKALSAPWSLKLPRTLSHLEGEPDPESLDFSKLKPSIEVD